MSRIAPIFRQEAPPAVAIFIWKQGSGGTTGTGISGAESQLLRMNLGDKNKVERLIQYEMRKKPGQ